MQIAQKNFYKKLLGRAGEIKAAEYLKKNGYKIAEKNYRTHIGEIDIIAEKDGVTVFIEVKTRTDDEFGYGAEAVNAKKREKYVLTAKEYLMRTGKTDSPCRFDVVEIQGGKINHIENAFCE